ncbi:CRTAC1 family protein [Rhodothermus bifroesti]|nr:CRTAC1 family protein [Rhodothermus bifroesti]
MATGIVLVGTLSGGLVVWRMTETEEAPYRPGERVEGVEARLVRTLPADYPRITFVEVTHLAGIDFRHFSGQRTSQIPEDMGSGAAWGDYDRDGWEDLYVVNTIGPLTMTRDEGRKAGTCNRLFRNNGDGTFTDVTKTARVGFCGWGMGATWGDYDNDGWPDLIVTAFGELVLYHNNGDGTFTEVTQRAGLSGFEGFWTGASWGDYDNDGDLDLYITGYVRYVPMENDPTALGFDIENPPGINPSSFEPERNLLFRNNGDGTFTEVASRAGVANPMGKSLSAAWVDLDQDGWLDLYVANDVSDNAFFRNRGDGTFEDLSYPALVADYRSSMGIAVGDWDGDGDLELFLTHWVAQENAFYTNLIREEGKLLFRDEADRYGLGQISLDYVGWGTFFFDYNNDGRPDLFVTNGSTLQQRDRPQLLVPQKDLLFWNRGADGFYDVSAVSGSYFDSLFVGRGAAFADYDRDGDLDLFVVNHGTRGVLLRNEGGSQQSWLQVALESRSCNRMALGAWVRVVVGNSAQVQQIGAQSSYLSQNSYVAHFGLGEAAVVDTVEVIWPCNGKRQRLEHVPARQRILIVESPAL